jgi:hypothetical protein
MQIRLTTPDADPQVREGKQIVEHSLAEKSVTDFEWSQDSGTRGWKLKFSFGGDTYGVLVDHQSLTNFKNDPAGKSKLAALWKNKSKL